MCVERGREGGREREGEGVTKCIYYMNGSPKFPNAILILQNRLHLQLEHLPASVAAASKSTADGALHDLPAGA